MRIQYNQTINFLKYKIIQILHVLNNLQFNIKMLKKICVLVIMSVLCLGTLSQILAIDLGTEFIKAAIVHSGAGKSFTIVQNHKSERKFTHAISFLNKQRFYETEALGKRNKIPTNSFVFSRLIVDSANDLKKLQKIKREVFLQYINGEENDQLMAKFILQNFPQETKEISLLEIFAMIIKHVKVQAERNFKLTVKDCVIAIPSHWDLRMRSFILSAASIADLYVLSLVSENTAAAINYALNQRRTNQTQIVMFYNLGSNSLQISLAEFRQIPYEKSVKPIESIFILGDYGKSFVGGIRFNEVLAKYFSDRFTQKYKRELNLRGKIKLLQESNKIKEILSSNKEATIIVEGIMDGMDFQEKITRAKFQELSQPLYKQLISPIKRFLHDNNYKPSEIKTVQLIGGSARLPKLQSLISEVMGSQADVGTRINGDQATALGSAFFAANSSKKFKVKGMHLYDGFNFQIRAVIRNLDETIQQGSQKFILKNVTVFKAKSRFGLSKEINFKCRQNIIVELYKEDENGLQLLRNTTFDKVETVKQNDFKLSFTLFLDPINVISIKDTKIIYRTQEIQTYTQKVKKNVTIPTESQQQQKEPKSTEEKQEQNKNQEQEKQEEQEKQQKQEKEKQEKQQEGSTNKTKKSKKKVKQQYETVEKNRTVTKKHERELDKIDTFILSPILVNEQSVEKSKKLLSIFQSAEEAKRRLAESKNKLQSVIYQCRDKLQNQQFLEFCQEQQKQSIGEQVKIQSEWMDETDSNNVEDYREHYENIYKILSKIKRRIHEFHERDTIKKQALKLVEQYNNLTKKLQKQKSWITDQQVNQLNQLIEDQTQQIEQIYKVMNSKSKHEDLVYRNKDLMRNAEAVKQKYFAIKATPKPKQTKKQQKTKEDNSDNKQQDKQKQNEKQENAKQQGTDEL